MLTYAILDVLKPTKNNALYKLLPRYGHGRPTSLRRSGDGYCRYFISFSKERRFSNSFILLLQLIHKGVKNWIGLSWYVTFSAFLQTAYANKQSFPFPQTQVKWRQATNDLGCVSCLLNQLSRNETKNIGLSHESRWKVHIHKKKCFKITAIQIFSSFPCASLSKSFYGHSKCMLIELPHRRNCFSRLLRMTLGVLS